MNYIHIHHRQMIKMNRCNRLLGALVIFSISLIVNASNKTHAFQKLDRQATGVAATAGGLLPMLIPLVIIFGLGMFLFPLIMGAFGGATGLGGLGTLGSVVPTGPFGRKRSIEEQLAPFNKEKLIDLISSITDAIENFQKKE